MKYALPLALALSIAGAVPVMAQSSAGVGSAATPTVPQSTTPNPLAGHTAVPTTSIGGKEAVNTGSVPATNAQGQPATSQDAGGSK